MKRILLKDVIDAVGGVLLGGINCGDLYIRGVSTDSRHIQLGELFIPLVGDHFDGHAFLPLAFEKGAVCCLTEREIEADGLLIQVPDTKKALRDLAEYYRGLFHIPVVAITGSTGKTTTKDMIASVLSRKFNVLSTKGNFNNEIGLPLTIFQLEDTHDVAVLEMGMNNFGEIHNLSKIARPDIALITNIGVSHIGRLGSREGILKAKCEIFDYMPDTGIRILNADDDLLSPLKGQHDRTYFYGVDASDCDVYADEIVYNGLDGVHCQIHTPRNYVHVDIKLPGKHMVSNALAAAAVGSILDLSSDEIKAGIESFQPSKMRMDIVHTARYTIINDAYNANPASTKAALDVLALTAGRKVAILGDMFELGHQEHDLHKDVGEYAATKGIEVIVAIGDLSKSLYEGAMNVINPQQRVYYFETQEAFFSQMHAILSTHDTILAKASRGMAFEKTIEKIKE